MTAVPSITISSTGIVAPAESAIVAGVVNDINSAFGGGVNPGATTPQGQLATSEAAILGDVNDQLLALFNGVDPSFASGRMQDAIGRLSFLTRDPATSTVVAALCTGQAPAYVPTGAVAQATDGNFYTCLGGGTFPGGGTMTLQFACSATGPIACPAGSLNRIYTFRAGWDSITNVADGVPGNNVESAQAFEARRQASVAGNSFGAIGSILGAVAAVPGVIDLWGYNNNTASPATVQGVTIPANSVWITVEGGTSAAIGSAIFSKIGSGGTGGSTAVTVTDPNPLYGSAPTYTINYQIPAALPIYVAVSIPNGPLVPPDALTQVQTVVDNAFLGLDGGPRARIGSTIFGSRFYAGIAALGPWAASIISVFVGTAAAPTTPDVAINADKFPTLTLAHVTLTLV